MVIALVLSVAGFILIFVAFRDSGNPNGLITLGVSECMQVVLYIYDINDMPDNHVMHVAIYGCMHTYICQ